ncbi:hypothetical protein [Pedobacter xixiisoli]|uniref:Uncharacterized protein n=1 Tax=Pedobacter xixiisoli TaxID=1476464 RepID=A0A286ACZ9_9SPHI|nr:hypothetical protein [Pedobacter xixiisoli]SOD19773.1 hypothetical protein SAMN06297358_3478 [Pedobacter xixiisoli]
MNRKTTLTVIAFSGILYSCKQPSPEDSTQTSVKTYITDSLKTRKISFQEFSNFDTITRYDSLVNEIKVINQKIEHVNTELKKTIDYKAEYDNIAGMASLFSNKENQNKIDETYENISRTIKNFEAGLELFNRNKNEALALVKDEKNKVEVSEYLIACKYLIGKEIYSETFVVNPKFKVVQTLK